MEEKHNIADLFNRIASTYDQLNHLLSLNIDKRWRKRAVQSLNPVEEALDVAVGTADLALELVLQQKARHVIGIDLSEEMIRIGQQKVANKGLESSITLEQGSALQLPYPDHYFSLVTCAYGVRNFSNLEQGLLEILRVLQPGGQVAILEFSYPDNRMISRLYDAYFTRILPIIGRWVSRDKKAYYYLNRSVKEFIWGEAMVEKLESLGYNQVQGQTFTFGITTLYTATK